LCHKINADRQTALSTGVTCIKKGWLASSIPPIQRM